MGASGGGEIFKLAALVSILIQGIVSLSAQFLAALRDKVQAVR